MRTIYMYMYTYVHLCILCTYTLLKIMHNKWKERRKRERKLTGNNSIVKRSPVRRLIKKTAAALNENMSDRLPRAGTGNTYSL